MTTVGSDPAPVPAGWDGFAHWADLFLGLKSYEPDERDYKLSLAGQLADVRSSAAAGDAGWVTALSRVLGSGQQNLINFRASRTLQDAIRRDAERAARVVTDLWDVTEQWARGNQPQPNDDDLAEAIDALAVILSEADISGSGTHATIASTLLLGVAATDAPVFRATAYGDAMGLVGWVNPGSAAPAGARYLDAVAFVDRVIDELRARGVIVRDRLDGQCLIWCITSWPDRRPDFPLDEWEALRRFRVSKIAGRPQRAARQPAKMTKPLRQVCPLCNDDESLGPVTPDPESGKWRRTCEGGRGHADEYEWWTTT